MAEIILTGFDELQDAFKAKVADVKADFLSKFDASALEAFGIEG